MSEASTTIQGLPTEALTKTSGFGATVFRNIIANFARVAAVSLVALVLPAYLIRHLPVQVYAAWVLIIQLGAYVSYLDLGIQLAISKFVAEYDARGNHAAASRHASAGFALMMLAGVLGVGLSALLAWRVPTLFASMPAYLFHDVRISLVLVGCSLSFGLVCAVYSAVFLGLQRYWIPTAISIVNRSSLAAVVIAVIALHGNLVAMGLGVAVVNISTGLIQVLAWRRKASHVSLSIHLLDYGVLKKVAQFCSWQSIWTTGMLCVSGFDIAIVGHFAYFETAYYSIATMPTNFVLLIISSLISPLMPATSALSTQREPSQMGVVLSRVTRYTTVALLLTGLPLVVFGFSILRIWVGPDYALHTLKYLRILILANVLRNLCAPYATMITATGRQGAATTAAISEALVNLGSSLYLASRFGAIGVAIGTLLGSCVSILVHFAITMHFTRQTFAISRSRLFAKGLLRPLVMAIPSLLSIPLWWAPALNLNVSFVVAWGCSTLALAWYVGLRSEERHELTCRIRNRLVPLPSA